LIRNFITKDMAMTKPVAAEAARICVAILQATVQAERSGYRLDRTSAIFEVGRVVDALMEQPKPVQCSLNADPDAYLLSIGPLSTLAKHLYERQVSMSILGTSGEEQKDDQTSSMESIQQVHVCMGENTLIVSLLAFEEYLRSYVVMPPVAYSTSGGDRSGERNRIPRIQISNAGFGFAV
jgi:hypothetical protein